ncbi:MAG: PepSY domain-containing protein [Campylobacteraceae bacterium]|nr:PepSY domain-containing protein [Campylobacteraceae bacterium]
MKKGFWFQIHWLLGIVLGVIIAIVGVTGAALSFRSEILAFINKDIVYVEPNGRTQLAVNELLEKANVALPNSRINSLTLALEPDKTARISVSNANSTNMRGKTYYIDPYTAEILPSLEGEWFFALMTRWHRWLGDTSGIGKQVVAIATIALIILSFSGLYLYWPFLRHKFFSSLTIDFKKKGRGFLYKLHSVFGIWTLIFVLLMSFTGLFWSYEWYRNGLYWLAGVERPMPRMQMNTNVTTAQNTENTANRQNRQSVNTTQEHSRAQNEHTHERAANFDGTQIANSNVSMDRNLSKVEESRTQITKSVDATLTPNSTKTAELYLKAAQAYELFKSSVDNDYITTTIMLPQYGNIFTFGYYPKNPAHSRASNQLQIDMEKNEVIRHAKYEDKKLGEKFMSSIFPLHSGDFFGMTGLILYCISSLAMALFAITGYMLYYDRFIKNRKKTKRKNA